MSAFVALLLFLIACENSVRSKSLSVRRDRPPLPRLTPVSIRVRVKIRPPLVSTTKVLLADESRVELR
jgi:hypothetical protein